MLLHAAFHLDPLSGRVLSHRFSDCRKRRLGVLSEERFSFAPGHGAQPAMVHATPDFMQEASLNTEDVFDFVANAPDALPAAVLKAIKEFPVDESQKDDETVNWVKGYPRVHVAFESHPDMVLLWDWYQSVMGPSRLKPFETAAADALSSLASAFGIETDVKADTGTDIKTSTETYIETGIKIGIKGVGLPYLNVIPNPLQSPMLADFVHKDDAVHAIVAEPRLTSVVHELLHGVFAGALRDSRAAVLDFRHLFTSALVSSMTNLQYAWDGGDESWLRVFEETLVRAASIWVKYAAKGVQQSTVACGQPQAQLQREMQRRINQVAQIHAQRGAQPSAGIDTQSRTQPAVEMDVQRDATDDTQQSARREAWRDAWHDAQREAIAGFIYVPPILRAFRDSWHSRSPHNMEPFIEDCLIACALPSPTGSSLS